MNDQLLPNALHGALISLVAKRDLMDWPDRQRVGALLGHYLAGHPVNRDALILANLLADDPRPEVRKEVAELLVHLPEEDFLKLVAKLESDTNAFVMKAVERAVVRRRKTAKQSLATGRSLDAVESRYAAMAKVHGPMAADTARRLADAHYDTLVQQTLHDLNNIISPITTDASTLRNQLTKLEPDLPFCVQRLGDMQRQLAYLASFLEEMRNYARSEGGERSRCRVAELVTEASAMARASLDRAGVSTLDLILDIAVPDHLTVPVARYQMVMALIHILKNAMESYEVGARAPHAGPRIVRVRASALESGQVAISVADNGPGIGAADLDTLREFLPGNTTKKNYGTGFGLPSAYRFAQAHGGTLAIDSQPNAGTTATITLPISGEDEE